MSATAARDLTALFDPGSVAIVGASNDERKYGNWLSVQAIRMQGRRRVHLINRRGEPVLGKPTFRALADVPGPVDLVVIAVPASGFEQAVDDALAAGTRAIVGVTAGFAELGADGRALQERVTAKIRGAGALLLGPNCLGVLDSTTQLYLASNPLPADGSRCCRRAAIWRWSWPASWPGVGMASHVSCPWAIRLIWGWPISSAPAPVTRAPT